MGDETNAAELAGLRDAIQSKDAALDEERRRRIELEVEARAREESDRRKYRAELLGEVRDVKIKVTEFLERVGDAPPETRGRWLEIIHRDLSKIDQTLQSEAEPPWVAAKVRKLRKHLVALWLVIGPLLAKAGFDIAPEVKKYIAMLLGG